MVVLGTNEGLEERLREMKLPDNTDKDVLSVVYGFRPVATASLWPNSVKPLAPQVEELREIAGMSGCSVLPGWGELHNIHFFARQGYEGKVNQYMQQYGSPLESDESDAALGRLLSYPECCAGNHPASGTRYAGKGAELIPFASCSYECAKPWIDFYKKLG